MSKLGIGIDTGGTYTDAVLYDFEKSRILGSAKALTTKEDLSIGIGNALDGLPDDLIREAEIVSLSTTLATNACVENKGGRAKLLLIGVDKRVVADVGKNYGLPDVGQIYFLESKTTTKGEILEPPDWDAFLRDSKEWIKDAYSVGIVEIHAMNNNAVLEKKARDLITVEYGLPVICGHELFSDLNSLQRGSSTLLNARLIPIIEDFLDAIKAALKMRNITAPIVIVRSDGTLMSEEFTTNRPVETLLCGPAASVMGGMELTKEKNCLIIDMGGTTTDIAIVKDGEPVKATDGIHVGKWRTFVKGVYINTFGLGGDSAIRFDRNGKLVLEPYRVIPLSIAADRWPDVTLRLKELLQTRTKHTKLLHEFFCLIKEIPHPANYEKEEIAFCDALRNGPLIYSDAADAIGVDIYNLNMHRLEKEGIVMRCGLTPTDIMHIRGDFSRYNTEAAQLGAEFVAACIGESVEKLQEMVYESVEKALYTDIVKMLLEDHNPSYKKTGLGKGLEALISRNWEGIKTGNRDPFLSFDFHTSAVLVGIGAPIHIFLPAIAKALGTKSVVPKYAGVANALGALVGNITATCEIIIKPQYSVKGIGNFTVFGKTKNSSTESKAEAIRIASEEAAEEARKEVIKRGASGDVTVTVKVIIDSAEAKDKIEIFLGIKVVARAVGRITI